MALFRQTRSARPGKCRNDNRGVKDLVYYEVYYETCHSAFQHEISIQ